MYGAQCALTCRPASYVFLCGPPANNFLIHGAIYKGIIATNNNLSFFPVKYLLSLANKFACAAAVLCTLQKDVKNETHY
jgi:hypothetical protein